jgi:hypothetical protein
MLAVISALKEQDCYLEGVTFIVVTNHKPNTYHGGKQYLQMPGREATYPPGRGCDYSCCSTLLSMCIPHHPWHCWLRNSMRCHRNNRNHGREDMWPLRQPKEHLIEEIERYPLRLTQALYRQVSPPLTQD